MTRLAEACGRLGGPRRYALAAVLGALAAVAMPPLHAIPLLWLAFTGLVWLVPTTVSTRSAFATGWAFGLGYFAASLYWLANALLIDPLRFGWLIPFAVFGLPAVLGVFTGLATLALRQAYAPLAVRVLVFAAAWTLAEWARGHVLTGFPWNLIGYAWLGVLEIAQAASTIGTYGLTFATVLIAALPALLGTDAGVRVKASALGASVVILAVAWVAGSARLAEHPTLNVPGVTLRLVQVSVPQALKWREDHRASVFERHLALSRTPSDVRPTHIVWPETAVPYLLADDRERRRAIAELLPPGGTLFTGVVRTEGGGEKPLAAWNSVIAITSEGAVATTYDKFHLVPFGEYLPLRPVLAVFGVDKIVYGPVDFSAGPGLRTLEVPGIPPFGALVCYEAIFPGRVTETSRRPEWLLNVSNDGWYGDTTGPHQHFAMARMRAIEEGLPLVRAANTGVSGVVDPVGRVTAALAYDKVGVIDAGLPQSLPETIYGGWGDWLYLPLLIVFVGFFLVKGVTAGTASRRHPD